MADLRRQLTEAGIIFGELATFAETDRGDVLFFRFLGGDAAVVLWEKLRGMAGVTGYWPVLLGDIEELSGRRDIGAKAHESVVETLRYVQTIDPVEWFAKTEQDRLAEIAQYEPDADPTELLPQEGEWPRNVIPNTTFSTPFDVLSRKPLKSVGVAMVPTQAPWEVVAFLEFGGWNDCPENAVHCALHRYWQHQHGAVIVAATSDVVEMKVERPPRTREAALALAKQQYAYCYDIVEQGTGTIANLAASLLGGTSWYFWWD
jgi:hypothetical protein